MLYFWIRWLNPTTKGIPRLPAYRAYEDENEKVWYTDINIKYDDMLDDWQEKETKNYLIKYCPIVHIFLIFTAFMKLMYFLRCYAKFG